MSHPRVSVIMNCLNGSLYLQEALDSIFAQTYTDWEIVFWDNGSVDDSDVIAQSYGEKVRYFRSDTTTSLGMARKQALNRCRGNYVALLDVDDVWLPQKLEFQLELMEGNPKLGLVFSDSICFDEQGVRYQLFKIIEPKRGKVFGELLSLNFMHTVSMLYRKEAILQLPYAYDSKFSMALDYELSLRIAYFYEIDYVDMPLCKWRMHPENQTSKKRFLFAHEMDQMLNKLCNEFPEIETKYHQSICKLNKSVSGQLAFEQWSKKNQRGARSYLKPFLKDPKFLMTYMLTYILSFSVFDFLKRSIVDNIKILLGIKF